MNTIILFRTCLYSMWHDTQPYLGFTSIPFSLQTSCCPFQRGQLLTEACGRFLSLCPVLLQHKELLCEFCHTFLGSLHVCLKHCNLLLKLHSFLAKGGKKQKTNKQAVIDWYLRNRQLDLWPCLIKAVSREGSDANQKFLRWFCTKPSKIECLTSLWPWPLTDFDQNLISATHHPPGSRGVIWHW